MLRLAHRILSQKKSILSFPGYDKEFAFFHALPSVFDTIENDCPVIIADNVQNYFAENPNEMPKSMKFIPRCPLPFPCFFLEYNSPHDSSEINCAIQVGFCIASSSQIIHKNFPDSTESSALGVEFHTLGNGTCLPTRFLEFYFDKNYQVLASTWECILDKENMHPNFRGQTRFVTGSEMIMLYTLALMQHKDARKIDLTKEEGPSPKWCRRQRIPELKYHSVQIGPSEVGEKWSDDARKTVGDRSGLSLHIRRSHFADYIDDGISKGRFGRNEFGRFFVRSCMVGSSKNGQVISTYTVKAPKK